MRGRKGKLLVLVDDERIDDKLYLRCRIKYKEVRKRKLRLAKFACGTIPDPNERIGWLNM